MASYSLKLSIKNYNLQMKTWLLLTAYRKLPAPYPMAPSLTPTTYRLAQYRTTGMPYCAITLQGHARSCKVNDLYVI